MSKRSNGSYQRTVSRRNSNTDYWRRRRNRHDELAEMAEEQLRAELEYWRELELISGQREHFKPGLTDETLYVDDEVRGMNGLYLVRLDPQPFDAGCQ